MNLMKNDTIFLKLGGSLITNKNKEFKENKEIIERLAEEIHEAREEKKFGLLVGNGGGSYPHPPAKKYRTVEGVINKESYKGIAEVQDAASRLNRIIVRTLLNHGESAVSINPSSVCLTKNHKIIEFYKKPLKRLLKYEMIPVVYGDVVLDMARGCSILSTEEIFDHLAKDINPYKVIYASDVDGVLTHDPKVKSDSKLIPEITPRNYLEFRKYFGASAGIDVTGGMLHKINKCMELAEIGIKSYIINGSVKNRVRDVLKGMEVVGTVIYK